MGFGSLAGLKPVVKSAPLIPLREAPDSKPPSLWATREGPAAQTCHFHLGKAQCH